MKKFTEKFLQKEGGLIRFLTARENGEDAWYIVKLDPLKYSEYKKELRDGDFDIADYGEILESGWGELSLEELASLKAKYGLA